ncbi:MAG: LexA family protein [Acutalibacteraceae bacterium]
MSIGKNIKNRRKELDLTQEDIAKRIGVSKQTVQKYESGVIANIPSDKIEMVAELLKTTPAKLMGWEEPDRYLPPTITDDVVTFPVIGEIAAGYDEIAVEDWSGETVEVPKSYLRGRDRSEFFVLSVHGDSMYPLYQDGDKVLILRQSTLNRSGDVGAIVYDGECATLKKVEYVQGEDWLRLIPINPNYPPREITGSDLEQCRVLGIPSLLVREINQ